MLNVEKVTVERLREVLWEWTEEEKPVVRNDPKLADVFRWAMVMLNVEKVTVERLREVLWEWTEEEKPDVRNDPKGPTSLGTLSQGQGHAEDLKGHSWKAKKSYGSEPEEEKPDVRNDPKMAELFW